MTTTERPRVALLDVVVLGRPAPQGSNVPDVGQQSGRGSAGPDKRGRHAPTSSKGHK